MIWSSCEQAQGILFNNDVDDVVLEPQISYDMRSIDALNRLFEERSRDKSRCSSSQASYHNPKGFIRLIAFLAELLKLSLVSNRSQHLKWPSIS